MVIGMYTDSEAVGTMKLDVDKECRHKGFATPSWRQNFQTGDTHKARLRILLASNPNTPASTLDSMANEDSPVLLERIAENPHASPNTLSKLAYHDNPRVRAAVAENSSLPEPIMWRLASDIHPDVRLRLAESYFLPHSILQVLAEDDNPYVQIRAKRTISRLNQPMTVSLSFGCC
jgi:hypothetical protein